MAYITNKERARRVRESNQSYFIRKILISVTVAFLVILVVFSIVTVSNTASAIAQYKEEEHAWVIIKALCDVPLSLFSYTEDGDTLFVTLSGFGWFMAVWSLITLGLAVASMVLMLSMKSPKAAKKNINVLQGAALSGKKLEAHANATQVYRERATNPKKLKKMNAKKRK